MSGELDYQALFRSDPTASIVLDPALVIVEANDAYLAATARTRPELVGRPVFEAFPDNPDDPASSGVAMLGASLRRVLRERVTDVMEIQKYDIPRPGGGFDVRFWAPVNAPVLAGDGELRWIVHSVKDVTSYVQGKADDDELARQMEAEVFARHRLERQHEALQAVVDSLEVAVIASGDDGRPALCNDAARELVGADVDQLTPEEWGARMRLHHPDGRPLGAELPLLRALRGEQVRDAEVVQHVPGRPQRIFRVHSRPLGGQPGLAAVVAFHDVTARRRAARLQACELAIAQVIAGSAPDDQVIDEIVRLAGSLAGWDAVEYWTRDQTTRLLHRVSRWAGPACALPRPDPELPARAWDDEHPVWVPDLGAGRAPLRSALAVPVPGSPHALGVLVCYSTTTDVPEDVRSAILTGVAPQLGMFLVRRRSERLAAALQRAHDEYVALAGHELRTPLTTIQAYTDLLLDEPGLTGDQRQMLSVMQRNATSLRDIILKLLDVAGVRAGRLDMRPSRMDLTAVVGEAVSAARSRPGAHRVEVDAPPAARIDGDPARLHQVLDELLANALTWSSDESAVRVRLTADGPYMSLTVTNTGAPIHPDEQDRIFDLFYRGDNARHRGIPGAGLGLSLAQAIVEQHGGSITLEPGDGSAVTFRVRLPISR